MNGKRIETYRVEYCDQRFGKETWHAHGGFRSDNIDEAVDFAHDLSESYPSSAFRVVRSVAYAEVVARIRPATKEGAGR